ncbi:MAG TPA: benzoate/H(+) symporter BenE family transporter [Gammaproteobacteria bacterium]|nr:benzoate/H(+) symporter BenE family transporter [Gammaproteobacteria bacterium]
MRNPFSVSHITAGFVAVLVGYASSIILVLQAASAAGATTNEIGSWLLALGIGTSVTSIGLSLYYRMPVLIAWSTPGAALLVTSLSGATLSEAVGAFIFSGILIFLSGVTGVFEKIMAYVPRSLASAMLAGLFLHFGMNIFLSMQHQPELAGAMLMTYLIGKRFFSRFVMLLVLLCGILMADMQGLLHFSHFHILLSKPIFTPPVFSLHSLIGIGIPLFIVTMASQNIPGIAIMKAAGYRPPVSSIMSLTGMANFLLAPFGAFSLNLAAITAAICLSEEADADPGKRHYATLSAGVFNLIAGLFGATVVALLFVLPAELTLTMAGLALLGTMCGSLKTAMEEETQREPALITFLVAASGVSLFETSAALWSLVAGILSYGILNAYKGGEEPDLINDLASE